VKPGQFMRCNWELTKVSRSNGRVMMKSAGLYPSRIRFPHCVGRGISPRNFGAPGEMDVEMASVCWIRVYNLRTTLEEL